MWIEKSHAHYWNDYKVIHAHYTEDIDIGMGTLWVLFIFFFKHANILHYFRKLKICINRGYAWLE